MTYIPASSIDAPEKPRTVLAEKEKPEYIFYKTRSIEKRWIERARKNPVDFIIYMTDGEKAPYPHHVEWIRSIFDMTITNLIIQAFPGSAKTTILVYCLAYLIGKFPWLTHIICSVSEEQAKQRLAELREIIESARYQNVFPHIHIDEKRPNNATIFNVWSSRIPGVDHEVDYAAYRQFVIRKGEPRDHTTFATGVTSKSITGKRVTGLILVDDPHDSNNSATPEQRTKVTNSIKKELMSRFSAKALFRKIIIIMTPWAEDDCAGQLMEDKKIGGASVWKMIKTPIRDPETGELTWGEVFTEEIVNSIEADRGPIIFDLMYMLNPIAAAGRKITLDMLRRHLPSELPEFKDITITTDFSETDKKRSDWSVFYAVARDKQKYFNCYLLRGDRFQENIIDIRADNLIMFYDETVLLFGDVNITVIFEADSKAEMQIVNLKRPDIKTELYQMDSDKENRFKNGPSGFIQQLRFFFNTFDSTYDIMCSELLGFPMAKHDDCVDPLSLLFMQPGWIVKQIRSGLVGIKSPFML